MSWDQRRGEADAPPWLTSGYCDSGHFRPGTPEWKAEDDALTAEYLRQIAEEEANR